jgi:hypothetical protein
MGIMVDDQGQNLDVVTDHMMTTNQNVLAANDNINDAN